eukprot:31651-Chlamydomonas_euryale.AAC.1
MSRCLVSSLANCSACISKRLVANLMTTRPSAPANTPSSGRSRQKNTRPPAGKEASFVVSVKAREEAASDSDTCGGGRCLWRECLTALLCRAQQSNLASRALDARIGHRYNRGLAFLSSERESSQL